MTQIEKLYSVLTDAINANQGVEDCVFIRVVCPNTIHLRFWSSILGEECFQAKFNGNTYFIDEFFVSAENGDVKLEMATYCGEIDENGDEIEQTFFNMEDCENLDELIGFLENLSNLVYIKQLKETTHPSLPCA